MSAPAPIFRDRADAGRRLAHALSERALGPVVVVGLARGGVPVAAEVAAALDAPLDALVVRKVGHPRQPELALGAVAAGGYAYLDPMARVEYPAGLRRGVDAADEEAAAMERRLRRQADAVPVAGRSCVLVDDGLATGATMRAAVRWARAQGAARVIVAAPVAAAETVADLAREADEVVCPYPISRFRAVGAWYRRFGQVAEDEVVGILRAARGGAGEAVDRPEPP